MNSAIIREWLYVCTPFALAIAATECHFSYRYRDISYMLLMSYIIALLLVGFYEKLRSLLKTEEHLSSKIAYGIIIFLVVAVVRQFIYGDLDKGSNLSVIRSYVMLTFLTFYNRAVIREMLGTCILCVAFDVFLSVCFCDENSDTSETSEKWVMLFYRVILILMLFAPDILRQIVLYSEYTLNSNILKHYKIYARPNEFSLHFLEDATADTQHDVGKAKMIDSLKTLLNTRSVISHSFALKNNVEILKEYLSLTLSDSDVEECVKLILYTVNRMDEQLSECTNITEEKQKADNDLTEHARKSLTVAKIVKEILVLATLLNFFCMLVKHNNETKERAFTGVIVSDSFVYFLIQPLLHIENIWNEIYDTVVVIWRNTYQLIVDQFQKFWKIVLFIITLTLNAIVFILIVHSVYLYSFQIAEYSIRHFQNIQHNIDIATDSVYGSGSYNGSARLGTYRRYPGEDVSFHCLENYEFRTGWRRSRIFWTHNGVLIDSSTSDRINISVTYHEYYAESELKVLLIKESDFGKFRCILQEETYEYIPLMYTYLGNGYKGTLLFEVIIYNSNQQVDEYELQRRTFFENTYEIAEGSFVVIHIDAYISFADFTDIGFQYTVNGIHILDICKHDLMSCYPFAYIKKKFTVPESTRFESSLGYYGLYRIKLWFCACSTVFGIHKLVIYREYYNKTTRKTESIEISYPVKFHFLPYGNDTGIKKELFINNTSEFISRYLENNDQIVIPIYHGSKLRLSVYSVFNGIAVLLYMIFIYYMLKALNCVTYFYCCLTIIPVRNKLLFGTFRQPLPQVESRTFAGITTHKEPVYDVYISHSESDYVFASQVILPYIENECGQKVCFPDRDLVHEAGASLLHLYIKATEQSRKFIVILSNSYLADTDCNGLQLRTCILPLITEKRLDEHDLLLIKLEKQIDLPVQISRNPRICVIDWTATNDERHKLRKIKQCLFQFH